MYDQYLEPDQQTLEVTDLATGDQLTTSDPQMGVEGDYTVAWDTAAHKFTITYSNKYVAEHWKAGTNPQVQVRFEGTVAKDAPTDRKVDNQWMLTLNNSITRPTSSTTCPRSMILQEGQPVQGAGDRPSASTGRPCCWATPATTSSPST